MDPEADDLYECIGAHPAEDQVSLGKKISKFYNKYGAEYRTKASEIDRKLGNIDNRIEYNESQVPPLPTTFGEVEELNLSGPTTVKYGDTVTVRVVNDDDDPVEGVQIDVSGTDAGTTGDTGQLSFAIDETGTCKITANKEDADTNYTPDTIEIEVVEERRDLHLSADPQHASTGERVTFTVEDENGERIEGATVSKAGLGGREAVTGPDGTCVLVFETAGMITVEATKSDEDGVNYGSDSTDLEVKRRRVSLDLSVSPDTIEIGDPVDVAVTTEPEVDIENVDISYHDATASTGSSARTSIVPKVTGSITVEASKPDDESATYESATTTVEVERADRSLVVSASPDPVEVNEPTTIRVEDDRGVEVADTTVTVGDTELTTGTDGSCSYTPEETGTENIRVTKTDTDTATYDSAETEITVTRRAIMLVARATPNPVEAETPVEITVTRERDDNPVREAHIDYPGGTAFTNRHGQCTISFDSIGSFDTEIRKDDDEMNTYEPASLTMSVEQRDVDLNLSVDCRSIESGDELIAEVTSREDEGIPDATVSFPGGTEETGRDGSCQFRITTIGDATIEADKADRGHVRYRPDSIDIHVSRRERTLNLIAPESVEPGEEFEVTVHDERGDPVEGARIASADSSDYDYTGKDGTATISLNGTGRIAVSATKPAEEGVSYNDARKLIDIDATEYRKDGEAEAEEESATEDSREDQSSVRPSISVAALFLLFFPVIVPAAILLEINSLFLFVGGFALASLSLIVFVVFWMI